MANLLASEPSAYLKSAAHQPVHWHPWGDAAFARARAEDKPILLDIGAVWCHWCHVMDGESYEDARVAEVLNADFVCIKVDRDERPDVDTRYQRAVQALTGQGGWPLTAFLTTEGEVRDHVGGGFHRYAVDERWIVPHFEKVAYDNSELLHAYLDGYAALGSPLFKQVAQGIVRWVLEVLSDGDRGAFYTSQDADVAFGDDGDYWTWTVDELRAALPEAAFPVARRVFDVEEHGEMHHNPRQNVLWRKG